MYFFWFYLTWGLGLIYSVVLTVLVCGVQPVSLRLVELKEYGTVASKEDDLDVLAHLCDALL